MKSHCCRYLFRVFSRPDTRVTGIVVHLLEIQTFCSSPPSPSAAVAELPSPPVPLQIDRHISAFVLIRACSNSQGSVRNFPKERNVGLLLL